MPVTKKLFLLPLPYKQLSLDTLQCLCTTFLNSVIRQVRKVDPAPAVSKVIIQMASSATKLVLHEIFLALQRVVHIFVRCKVCCMAKVKCR